MEILENAARLRIVVGEADKWEHKPLYEALVLAARKHRLAGATVLRGPMGFGASSRVHTAKVLQLSMDRPFVVEIVDRREKVEAFLEVIGPMIDGGLVTVEDVKVVHYRAGKPKDGAVS